MATTNEAEEGKTTAAPNIPLVRAMEAASLPFIMRVAQLDTGCRFDEPRRNDHLSNQC